jgi:8-oxo-dGTP pyrophosphatase MutT (NUDIX family)
MGPWAVRNSKYVIKDEWIKVRADECITPEGLTIDPYYVLEYPDWVHMVLLDSEDRILVTRAYRHGMGKISIEIPCGSIEASDDSPLAAARRELLEETGYGGGEFIPVGDFSPNPANHNNRIHCFLVMDASQQCEPINDPYERIDCELIKLKELADLIDSGDFHQSMHIASILLSLRKSGKLHLLM